MAESLTSILNNRKNFFTERRWSGIGTNCAGRCWSPHPQKRSTFPEMFKEHLDMTFSLVDMVELFGQRLDLILEVFSNDSKCVFNLSHPVGLQYPVFLLSPLTCCCLQMPSTNYAVVPPSSWSLVYDIYIYIDNNSSLAPSLWQLN